MALVFFGFLMAGSASAAILPADRSYPWNGSVGIEGGIPDSSAITIYTNVPVGTSYTQINTWITAASSAAGSGYRVITFDPGTHTLANDIQLKTGVILKGAGTNTVLVFTSGAIYAGGTAMYNALRGGSYSGGGSANWTAGYSQGASNLTFSSTSPGLTVGNLVFLDQSDDHYFAEGNGYEGNPGGPRDDQHSVCQISKVTAINGSTVTIWPPVAATWINSSLNPGAVWIGASSWASRMGVENMTIDCSSSSAGHGPFSANIDWQCVHSSWVKGVKSINAKKVHVFFGYGHFRNEVRDCYFYGTQSTTQQSYGIAMDWGSNALVENNVFEKIVLGMATHQADCCNAFLYNYVTNAYYTASSHFLMAGAQPHDHHVYMELYEGNHFTKFAADFIHGSHSHEVLFRNRITGYEAWSYPDGTPTTANLGCVLIDITNRCMSSVGNILGTSGVYANLLSVPGSTGKKSIYEIGIENTAYGKGWGNDSITWNSFFRHMDYDTVSGTIYYNPTNADVTLPKSLYYTSTPSWWPAGLAWPPFNPSNTTASAISPTNLPAGHWRVYGTYSPAGTTANQAPSITDIVNQSTTVNTATGNIAFTVSDPETAAGSLTLSAASSNPSLVPVGNIVFGGSGGNRTVRVTPATGQTGATTITITVSDGSLTASDSFLLTVSTVNTPPTISSVSNRTIVEDTSTGTIPFTVGDAESAASTLSLTGASSNASLVPVGNIAFGGTGASRTVVVTPIANGNGSTTITLTVSDGQNTASTSFLLTVTPVNDAPTISPIADQWTTPGTSTASIVFTIQDLETTASSLTLTKASSNPALVPVNGIVFGGSGTSRNVVVTPAPGQTGTTTITITVSDGALAASSSFVLSVASQLPGLVAAYGFEENSGNSVTDSSGGGNSGTITGAARVGGKFGSGLSFNGTSSIVSIPDAPSLDLTSSFTLEAWVQPVAVGGWRDVVFKDRDLYFLMGSTPTGSAPCVGGTFASANTYASASLPLSTWTHLAGTYDGATLKLYLNGVQVAVRAQSGPASTSSGALTIGGDASYGQYWSGLIDEVRVYNRALSVTEILTDMNTPVLVPVPKPTVVGGVQLLSQ